MVMILKIPFKISVGKGEIWWIKRDYQVKLMWHAALRGILVTWEIFYLEPTVPDDFKVFYLQILLGQEEELQL